MNVNVKSHLLAILVAGGVAFAVSPGVSAQETQDTTEAQSQLEEQGAQDTTEAQPRIEEIIVTATRREESIQEVPVSVSAVTGDTMRDWNVLIMSDLSDFVPNFRMAEATMVSNLYIRGLGSGISHSVEQSVGLFVDGVYIGRADANNMGFLDVGMVEVLRGPQGTLFGKNTVAGALIVRTNDPTESLEGRVTVTAGAYDTTGNHYPVEGFVSGPISDDVSYRFAVAYGQDDGYVENLNDGPNGSEREDIKARGKLHWKAGDNTTVDFRIDYFDYSTDGQAASEVFNALPPVAAAYTAFDPSFNNELDWKSNVNCDVAENNFFCPERDQDLQTYAMTINHDFNAGTLTSITAFQQYGYLDNFYTGDNGLIGAFSAVRNEDFDSLTQEFRLVSNTGGKVDYIAGLYYEQSTIDRDQQTPIHFPLLGSVLPGIPPLPPLSRNENWDQDTQSIAAFAQLRWHVSDAVTLVFGGRNSTEDKDFEFERFYTQYFSFDPIQLPPPALPPLYGNLGPPITRDESRSSRSEDKFTGMFTLQYRPNENNMLYYNLTQGHKTGGFDDRVVNVDDIEFEPEESLMHEVGVKSTFADGRGNVSLAIFNIDFEDLQVTSFLPDSVAFVTTNAAEATSMGVELEANFQPTDSWLFGGSVGYLDATYDKFDTAPCTLMQSMGMAPGCVDGVQDLSGRVLQNAPEWSANVFALNTLQFGNGWNLATRIDVNYSDEYFMDLDLDVNLLQESYAKLNASIRLIPPQGNVEISLMGRNLTNERTLLFGTDTPLVPSYFAQLSPPRDVSLIFTYNFR